MACLRKRKLKKGYPWVVDFYQDCKRHVKSTGTSDKRVAEKVLKKIEGDLVINRFDLPTNKNKKVLLKDFINKYLEEYSSKSKSRNTYLMDKEHLNKFLNFIGNKDLKEISQYDAEKFKSFRLEKVSKNSTNI